MLQRLFKWFLYLVIVLATLAAYLGFSAWRAVQTDNGGVTRQKVEHFEMGGHAADNSARPAPDGFIRDSSGDVRIMPPMPPEKPMDVHTAANYLGDYAIRSCFWPGPRARTGVFTNEATNIAVDSQFPDVATTYMPTALKLPEGSKLVIHGEFPHMRHWNYNTYNADGQPQDMMTDVDILPDPGSENPFRPEVSRDVAARHYTITVESGFPPTPRPANTIYTFVPAGGQVYLWMRNYVPDQGTNYLGGVALPSVELHLQDNKVLTGEAACAATDSEMRGKQLARTINPYLYLALTYLPWADRANIGASRDKVVPLRKFYSRPDVLAHLYFPWFVPSEPKQLGGWWSNRATNYGYVYLSRNFGSVYYMTGKMPKTPSTWHGDKQNMSDYDMRYMSVCTAGAPPAGVTPDCVYDEQLIHTVDSSGQFAIVISQGRDRPANATSACGVEWLDMGNGDGMVGGSPDYGAVINRHTTVSPKFRHSWFDVTKTGAEKQMMGDFLPYLINMKDKAAFEALGCPVDKSRIRDMVKTTAAN